MSIGYFQWTKIGCFRWTWSGCFRRTLTPTKNKRTILFHNSVIVFKCINNVTIKNIIFVYFWFESWLF